MRILLVAQFVLLFISLGYAFRITDFLETFISHDQTNDRQSSDVSDQIIPVFLIAFFASLVNSLLMMNLNTAASTTGKIIQTM